MSRVGPRVGGEKRVASIDVGTVGTEAWYVPFSQHLQHSQGRSDTALGDVSLDSLL